MYYLQILVFESVHDYAGLHDATLV